MKKVADGYGRNYLFPKGLAVLSTPGAVKQADKIRSAAETQRSKLNQELGGVAEKIGGLTLVFPGKAGETGKLYGSITTAMLAEAIQRETGFAAAAQPGCRSDHACRASRRARCSGGRATAAAESTPSRADARRCTGRCPGGRGPIA